MSAMQAMRLEQVSVVFAGSGGSGVMTIGGILLEAAARAGYYGLFSKLFGPQVRGGEAAALLTLGPAPVECGPDVYDLFVALDWQQLERFAAEIPLSRASVILCDPKAGELPAGYAAAGALCVHLPFAAMAAQLPGARANMVALGAVAALLGLPLDPLERTIAKRLADKGETLARASVAAASAGYAALPALDPELRLSMRLPPPAADADPRRRWLISGDDALALGGLRGGVRFVAGYPITPATELVEWITPALERLGGHFVQAEDELAAINMVIGGSFGGVPSMTVTSGPGFSLMSEAIGLAIAAEIPVVVLDVQRAGPSTGIPSKTEQSDLNMALYGTHGDAPRLVLAPTSVGDGLATMQWAVELAEALQTAAIVLSDQQMGQAHAVIDAPGGSAGAPVALVGAHGSAGYAGGASVAAARASGGAARAAAGMAGTSSGRAGASDGMMGASSGKAAASAGMARASTGTVGTSARMAGLFGGAARRASGISAPTRVLARPAPGGLYKRYALTPNGVSPMSLPGTPGAAWVGEGLTHNESGAPVSGAKDHVAQIDKRRRKLVLYEYGARWADLEGEGELAVITWGSSAAPVRAALARLRDDGARIRLLVPRLIAPLQKAQLARALAGVARAIVIEQNDAGQLCGYLRAQGDLPIALASYSRPGPLPFRAAEIYNHLKHWGMQ